MNPLSVVCPACNAKIGKLCTRDRWGAYMDRSPHRERIAKTRNLAIESAKAKEKN